MRKVDRSLCTGWRLLTHHLIFTPSLLPFLPFLPFFLPSFLPSLRSTRPSASSKTPEAPWPASSETTTPPPPVRSTPPSLPPSLPPSPPPFQHFSLGVKPNHSPSSFHPFLPSSSIPSFPPSSLEIRFHTYTLFSQITLFTLYITRSRYLHPIYPDHPIRRHRGLWRRRRASSLSRRKWYVPPFLHISLISPSLPPSPPYSVSFSTLPSSLTSHSLFSDDIKTHNFPSLPFSLLLSLPPSLPPFLPPGYIKSHAVVAMSPSGYDAPKVAEALQATPTLVVFAGQDSEEVRA